MQATRREFLAASAAAGALGAGCARPPSPSAGTAWTPRVSENVGNLNADTLTWLAQLGLEWVVLQGTDHLDHEGKGYWSDADLEAATKRCSEFGLTLHSLMLPFDWLLPAMLASPERDARIEDIRRSVAAAGAAGIEMLEWRWSPDFKWGAEVGYYDIEGRGGAVYKGFNYDTVADAPPFEDLGPVARADLFERLVWFTERVMPAAERAGVKMSLHPKDPPVASMRGVDRLLTNTDEIEQFLDAVDSPANGFTFCQGTVTEMGVDVLEAIERIGRRGRIHHVHFRAVRGSVPHYVETFIDEGEVDMLAAMRAYKQVDYRGSLVSDHSPRLSEDLADRRVGRTYSHGYIRGLIQAVNAEG